MSPDPLTVTGATAVTEIAGMLRRYGIRHLAVVEHDRLVGMLSDRDVPDRIADDARHHVVAPARRPTRGPRRARCPDAAVQAHQRIARRR
jgi:CBS domain-containing protein